MPRFLHTVLLLFATLAVTAQDFTIEALDGRLLRVDSVVAERSTLLLFFDPDCTECRQELFAMRCSSLLRQHVADSTLQVVCVYVGTNDSLWRETARQQPNTWTMAICRKETDVPSLYDLSSLPVLYLMDTQKHIVQQAYELRDIRFRKE